MDKEKNRESGAPIKAAVEYPAVLPMIPVRDMVACPLLVSPILVGRPCSVAALEEAQAKGKLVVVATQLKEQTEEPKQKDLYPVATLCRILQVLRQEETISMLVEGIECVAIEKVSARPFHQALVSKNELALDVPREEKEALRRVVLQLFTDYASTNSRISPELVQAASKEEDDRRLYYLIIGNLYVQNREKMALLSMASCQEGFRLLGQILSRENELKTVERRIMGEVRQHIDEQQKSYFLNEQIKAIEQELGHKGYSDADEYYERLGKTKLPKEIKKVVEKEIQKLTHMAPFTPETTVVRSYLDWVFDLPWGKETIDSNDLGMARKILDASHYGLKDPKERVMEYLAVRALRQSSAQADGKKAESKETEEDPSTVLCLTGPPGVGKTTLAKSVAQALGRKFVRISLGGVSDEAEIRGHRRTYIGSMPGRIVQALKKAGSMNPVILLDEIDKLGSDYRGDPTAALLEVLDPEQNKAFNDHFLEIDLDLSKAVFICTANIEEAINPTLRDRMEKIELTSYTEQEKLSIARTHLLEKQGRLSGLASLPKFTDEAILHIVRDYTCESGVRQLEREIARIYRKLALEKVTGLEIQDTVDGTLVRKLLGPPKQFPDLELPPETPGVAMGLAWTEVGGAILKIEVSAVKGKGDLLLTGQLGDVMQESARAALTFIRRLQPGLGSDPKFFAQHDIHIHVPEGAIPKDGPSAGITLACALYSVLTDTPLKPRLAMTGEVTLIGTVLPIGGVKEKLLAAHRAGVKTIILPKKSEAELEDVPKEVLSELEIHKVERMEEVLAIAFPKVKAKKAAKTAKAAKPVKKTVKEPEKTAKTI